ncbi:MAG TPA: Nif3-like dinuclear metal center hexameric protein [Agriterribacter sp.]|nr:Nif3-like dinuclear metal center hexameric protein [Agriterribacter sp.]
MKIKDIINVLEIMAPPGLQETYDNAGLIIGNREWNCTGAVCALDVTEAIIDEAVERSCNLVVAHHPIIFKGLKRITGNNCVERTIIKAIKSDIAIYAVHTNLDNIIAGVNGRVADKLGLTNRAILLPKEATLKKLYTFVPVEQCEQLRTALFGAGAGHIGNYSHCSFNTDGAGTFKAEAGTNPFVGVVGELHIEKEVKIEVVFPAWLEQTIVETLISTHPYEEPAYDILPLSNTHPHIGSGITGLLPHPMEENQFLAFLKKTLQTPLIRHTRLTGNPIQRVSFCGGAGSFLISNALTKKSDIFICADIKYHEFFDADGRMIIADIGHFESEQFTIDLLHDILLKKFPTFAILKTTINTNPVLYYV